MDMLLAMVTHTPYKRVSSDHLALHTHTHTHTGCLSCHRWSTLSCSADGKTSWSRLSPSLHVSGWLSLCHVWICCSTREHSQNTQYKMWVKPFSHVIHPLKFITFSYIVSCIALKKSHRADTFIWRQLIGRWLERCRSFLIDPFCRMCPQVHCIVMLLHLFMALQSADDDDDAAHRLR